MVKERVSNKASCKHFYSSEIKKMADKKRFLNQHGRVIDPGVFNKTIILLRLDGYKIIITNSALRALLDIYLFICSARIVKYPLG